MGAGFLGMSYSPFVVQNPNAPIANLKPPAGSITRRMQRRLAMLGLVENDFIAQTTEPGGRRSQGRLRKDDPDDELASIQTSSI